MSGRGFWAGWLLIGLAVAAVGLFIMAALASPSPPPGPNPPQSGAPAGLLGESCATLASQADALASGPAPQDWSGQAGLAMQAMALKGCQQNPDGSWSR